MSLIPLYRFIGPATITIIFILFLVGMGRIVLTVALRAFAIIRVRGPGVWLISAFWGTLFQLAMSPSAIGGQVGDENSGSSGQDHGDGS
jgi:hypothetical protein